MHYNYILHKSNNLVIDGERFSSGTFRPGMLKYLAALMH